MTDSKNKPVDSIRDGSLTASIWANESENGTRYSVDLTRSYKVDDKWHTTQYLSNGEILRGSRLLTLAYDRILQLKTNS
jgi:hypothetical protein